MSGIQGELSPSCKKTYFISMKLIIQIPCFNEENDLPRVLADLPRSIHGVDEIEVLIIDDGSTDRTSKIAGKLGVKHIIRFPQNRGLAHAFMAGIRCALGLGADIIVNTDGDNQYKASFIPQLIAPIVEGKAQIVIGDRQVQSLPHFSLVKKVLHGCGSWLVRKLSHTRVPDPVSGFRAYNREAALRMNVLSDYSYTVETLIQAGRNKMAIASVPIEVNKTARSSRLFKSISEFVRQMALTMIRTYVWYQPLKVFSSMGLLLVFSGIILFLRFLFYIVVYHNSAGHIQSLILGAVLVIVGFQTLLIGLLGDEVAANRKLIEENLIYARQNILGIKEYKG